MSKKPAAGPATAEAIREAARAVQAAAQTERPVTRRFTTAFKERLIRELAELRSSGVPGAMAARLRTEGLTRDQVARWQKRRDNEELRASPKAVHNSMVDELDKLRRENERLAIRLAKAEVVIDVQKKLSKLLGIQMPDSDSDSEIP